VVCGDFVYFTCDDGYIFAVSVEAKPTNPTYRMLDASAADSITWMPWRDRIDPNNGVSGGSRVSLTGSNGLLAVPCSGGLYVFGSSMNLVTDNHRVMEIGADGKVSWSCDSVYEPKEVVGAQALSPGQLLYGLDSKSLNKPLVAQKFAASDYLVVDSGNDRVIRMDKGGQVTWALTRFEDPQNLLRSGEPKTLKAPSDARMWSEFEERGGNWYYMIHSLVVDTGNFRIVDIVDRYDAKDGQIGRPSNPGANGRPIHELNWVSSTTYRDKRFTFNSVQLVRGAVSSSGGPAAKDNIWASVSNYGQGTGADAAATGSTGGGQIGGAILSMDYRQSTGASQWTYMDGKVNGQLTTLDGNIQLAGPTYFTVLDATASGGSVLLICDSSCVYRTTGTNIDWKFTAEDYAAMTRTVTTDDGIGNIGTAQLAVKIPFAPKRVQALPNNRYLIVNSYAGRTNDANMPKFVGEVFEIDAGGIMKWYTPDIWQDTSSGELMQKMKNAANLDQPTCAQRLY
jgi:hypothetical protein